MVNNQNSHQSKLSLFITLSLFTAVCILYVYNTGVVLPPGPWEAIPLLQDRISQNEETFTPTNRSDVTVKVEPGTYHNNQLVYEPVVYTVSNNSDKTISFLRGCAMVNPEHCLSAGPSCISTDAVEPYCSEVPFRKFINPGENWTGLYYPVTGFNNIFEPAGQYRLRFLFTDIGDPAESTEYTTEEFLKNVEAVYSDSFRISQIPLSKASSEELCKNWDIALTSVSEETKNTCRTILEKQFSSRNHPLSIADILSRSDLLMGEEVTVKARLFLGSSNTVSGSGPYTVFPVLKDIFYHTDTPIFLYQEDDFVSCESNRRYLSHCNDWKHEEDYIITGTLHKGNIIPSLEDQEIYINVLREHSY